MNPLVIALLLALPLPAVAAPFCIYSDAVPPQCIYVDAASCSKHATQLGGYCAVNGSEVHIAPPAGHYCVLTSSLVSSCIYVDLANCTRDARQQHGVCLKSTVMPGVPPADPYQDIRPPGY